MIVISFVIFSIVMHIVAGSSIDLSPPAAGVIGIGHRVDVTGAGCVCGVCCG